MSNNIKEAIGNIVDKKLKQMKENFDAALTEKASAKLEEMKSDMGSKFFK